MKNYKRMFSKEFKTFKRNKKKLLRKHKGKFVVIKGEKILGIYEGEVEAVNAGYQQVGVVPLFVKQILPVDPPIYLLSLCIG